MKWTKIETQGKDKKRPSEDDEASYVFFKDQASLDRAFGIEERNDRGECRPNIKQSHLWVNYKLKKQMNTSHQRDYEIFCGGYLLYYDKITRSNVVDHHIHFEWYQSDGSFYVAIYLSPPPAKKQKDISSQSKPTAPGANHPAPDSLLSATNPSVNAEAQADTNMEGLASIDPPPIPPPPPPPRD